MPVDTEASQKTYTPIRAPRGSTLSCKSWQQEAAMKYFNKYFGIRYPFEKLDEIGLPDFAAGAMENTGFITYREVILLVDNKEASAGLRKAVATVIAHEMAHQWFGDMVTMQWWDDIWLNEGFATWMESKAIAEIKPEWHMMSRQGHLNDRVGHWHPHLMFLVPSTEAAAWGADLPGSPILADDDTADRMTVFMIPVGKWADGTSDSVDGH